MGTGRVTVFDEERNFGFVQPDSGGFDVFVHASVIEEDERLRPGDLVEYDVEEEHEHDTEPRATSVRIVDRAPEHQPAGRVVVSGAPPTWDELEDMESKRRKKRRRRRRRR